jgi:RNA polymerase sigma-70 factor (ECF subfamily)
MDASDSELLKRHLEGDGAAFGEIVDRYAEPLVRLASRLSGDTALAQDLVQETFLRLVRIAPTLVAHRSIGAWLIEVCGNLSRDALKTGARRRGREQDDASAEPAAPSRNGHADPAAEESRAALEAALGDLPIRQRQAVVLRIWDALSYRDIAAALQVSEGEVGYLLHHGLNRLARSLTAAGLVM